MKTTIYSRISLPCFFLILIGLITSTSYQSYAGPGDINTNFGQPILTIGDSTRFNSDVNVIHVQPDQKILVGGNFTTYNGVTRNRILRLNADGTLDTLSFNMLATGFQSSVHSITMQSDGKILVGGAFTTYNSQPKSRIVRLEYNGAIDTSFIVGTGFNNASSINSIVIQPDGKILAGGTFTSYNGTTANRIVRLNPNGSIDSTFISGTGFPGEVKSICYDSLNNQIYVAGLFTSYNGNTVAKRIVRLDATGTIDVSFNIGTGFNGGINKLLFDQASGTLVAAGDFTSYNGTTVNRITRIQNTGALDFGFIIGSGFNTSVWELKFDGAGNIICAGNFTSYNGVSINRLCRLTNTGILDNSFVILGGADNDIFTAAVQNNGHIIFGGQFTNYNNTYRTRIARINPYGGLDKSFNIQWGFNSNTHVIKEQTDGKIIIGGDFTRYDGSLSNYIVRLDNTGNIDTTFHPGTGANWTVRTVTLDTINNKYYIGGDFTTFDGVSRNRLARLNSDGSLDLSFSIGTGFNGSIYSIALQSNGKVLVGGSFTSYDGVTRNRILRLENNGTLDNSYNIGTGFNGQVYALALQSDGKIVAGGQFTNFNNTASNYISRLDTNGIFDNSFITGNGFNTSVNDLLIQPDNKILVCGAFTNYNSSTVSRGIARLESNGSIDGLFNTNAGSGADYYVNRIALARNGRIILGGNFSTFNGYGSKNLALLDNNGTINNQFSIGTGFNSTVIPVEILDDESILVGGNFTKYNLHFINYLVKIDGDPLTEIAERNQLVDFSLYPNPTSSSITFEMKENINVDSKIIISNILGTKVFELSVSGTTKTLDISTLSNGIYFFELKSAKGSSTKKFIKQ
ncbi:MAG: T9SS type A sorting domain-containing protein [Bacteroidetes bacterium]|nr:MAG: T9SS type A sorting domain-containing protein [Bacteroidota bacterium]